MNDIKGIIEDVEKSSLVSNKVIKKVIEIIGQEKWQDINDEEDDICTTAGELIITLDRIAELEKENAELKKEVELWKKASENNSYKAFQLQEENKTISGKLTKAKEIIKTFLGFAEAFGYSPSMDAFITEVEQFLT